MQSKRVLSIGQCGADHAAISLAIERTFSAEIIAADTSTAALTRLREENFDLVIVNRILDSDGSSGLDLITELKADAKLQHLPIMLVSNYENYQHEAVAAGALPGFGKAALGQPQMIDRLRKVLVTAENKQG